MATSIPPERPRGQASFAQRAKIALIEKGWSVADLARRIKRDRATVSLAIHHDVYKPTRALICRELGL